MPSLVRSAARLGLDLLFPPQCVLCRASGTLLCEMCVAMLPLADGQRCERCLAPVTNAARCARCSRESLAFEFVRSPFVLDGDARMLVHRLKYDGMSALGEPMARLMLDVAGGIEADVVVPVPLHRGRQRSRGYNQSRMLAAPLANELGIDLDVRAALRVRATAPLAMAMSRDERRRIVAGAFAADAARVSGARVLLLDDVTTTGATLDACASALREAGAASVRCVTFARAH